jgi:hypothetical protein
MDDFERRIEARKVETRLPLKVVHPILVKAGLILLFICIIVIGVILMSYLGFIR